jgi:ribose-phosphate pyrophosphokinase
VKFADGEMEVEVGTSLRGKDVYIFASAARNTQGLPVEENKQELYHTVDALRRAAAGKITLFEPYCTCSRSDRTTRRNSVGFWIHYKTLVSLGVDHIVTYNLHSDKSRTVVDPTVCSIEDVPASALLKEYITDTFIKTTDYPGEPCPENWLFCSVDAGGESVAKRFARAFGTQLVIAHKQRDYKKPNTVQSISILTSTDIEGKEIWIVDDMIDTGRIGLHAGEGAARAQRGVGEHRGGPPGILAAGGQPADEPVRRGTPRSISWSSTPCTVRTRCVTRCRFCTSSRPHG